MEGAVAIAALLVVAGLAGCLVWAVRWGQGQSDAAHRSAVRELEADRHADAAIRERDAALASDAKHIAELSTERKAHEQTGRAYTVAVQELRNAKSKELAGATDADIAGVVARMLEERMSTMRIREAAAAARADRGATGIPIVPRPGPGSDADHTDEPGVT